MCKCEIRIINRWMKLIHDIYHDATIDLTIALTMLLAPATRDVTRLARRHHFCPLTGGVKVNAFLVGRAPGHSIEKNYVPRLLFFPPTYFWGLGQRPKQVYLVRLGQERILSKPKSRAHITSPAIDWSITHCSCFWADKAQQAHPSLSTLLDFQLLFVVF